MLGFGAIFLALFATSIAGFYFFRGHNSIVAGRTAKLTYRKNGKTWFVVASVFIGTSAAYLLYLIFSNNYQFAYVYSYSSRDLSLAYKLAAFWAGQEGSFLLWLVFHSVFGLILLRQKDLSPAAMAVYSIIQIILILFLLVKSPFMMIAEPQIDGAGLNPLLQDPWMVIHPPVVFLGYAGLAVPFAYALGGLLSRNHQNWLTPALWWSLLSWGALGAGIFIGGFWAYKVLGWGGYWAWDPVENSSLVPWLAAGALVHLLFLARIRTAGIKYAYIASIFSFILVLYGTFLTRSGVLSDFSTHSFADEGAGGLLAGGVFVTTLISCVILLLRWETLPSGQLYPGIRSREFMLACTSLVFAMLAGLVFIGMSTPVVTMLLGNAQNVSAAFYNLTALPLAAALAILLAAGPLSKWGANEKFGLRKYWWVILFAHGGIFITIGYGIYHPLIITVVFFSLAGAILNMYGAAKRFLTWPAGLVHTGVALMLIGIMVSSAGNQSQIVSFDPGQAKRVFGYELTYAGIERMQDGNGFYHNFAVGGQGGSNLLQSLTKLNKEGRQSAREPGIYRTAAADLYVAPLMQQEKPGGKKAVLRKSEKSVVEGLELTFIRAAMSNQGKGSNEDIHIQAVFEAAIDGKTIVITPEVAFHNGRIAGQPVTVFERYEVTLNGVNPSDGTVSVAVRDLTARIQSDSLSAEVSYKPLINLVWLGATIITIGTCWAGYIRYGRSQLADLNDK
mgnify:FL=1